MRILFIILIASLGLVLAVAGAFYWRVRRLGKASQTQFMRATEKQQPPSDPNSTPSSHLQ